MAGEQNFWDNKVYTSLYLERRHVDALDAAAHQAGCSRQWMLRLILEKTFGGGVEVTPASPARISL